MKEDAVAYGSGSEFVFKEAVDFLKSKAAITPEQFKLISKEYQVLAFSVEGYTSLEVLHTFLDKLTEAAEAGTTKEQFQKDMNLFLEQNGYVGLNPTKADTIFRTNIQTAFNVGHYKSMTEPMTKKLRPYWQYVTAGDGRVRDSHESMEGRVYACDDPIWDIWYPPNGFKCRCHVNSLSKNQVENRGYIVDKQVPTFTDKDTGKAKAYFPDKGFSSNPAKAKWQPDLSGFPSSLKEAFLDREKSKTAKTE